MKKKLKYILGGVGVAVFIVACYFGGQILADQAEQKQLAELEQQRQEQTDRENAQAAHESPGAAPEVVKYELPIPKPTPKPTPKPSAVPSETVTVDEDGTITIIPNFEAQINAASKVVTPGSAPTANMGGSGGGDLPLGDDGAYHGDNPATPKPVEASPATASTPEPVEATPTPTAAPTPAPVTTTPDQGTTDPTQTASPAPEPSSAPQDSTETAAPGGPPSRDGKYDGEISPDGEYVWNRPVRFDPEKDDFVVGSPCWEKLLHDNGGIGGTLGGWEGDTHTGLSGNKVGNM